MMFVDEVSHASGSSTLTRPHGLAASVRPAADRTGGAVLRLRVAVPVAAAAGRWATPPDSDPLAWYATA